jgi:hypothetical protein
VLVVAPRGLLDPAVAQPAGSLLDELATGHPDRTPRELVFSADLAAELRAWQPDTAALLTAELAAVAAAVVGCWQHGGLLGLDLALEPGEDARTLTRPVMTLAPRGAAGPAGPPGRPGPLSLVASKQRPPRRRAVPVVRGHGGARTLRSSCGALPAWPAIGLAADGGQSGQQTPDPCPTGPRAPVPDGHRAPVQMDTAGAVGVPERSALRSAMWPALAHVSWLGG